MSWQQEEREKAEAAEMRARAEEAKRLELDRLKAENASLKQLVQLRDKELLECKQALADERTRAEKAEALVCTMEAQCASHDEAMRRVTADNQANLEAARKAEARVKELEEAIGSNLASKFNVWLTEEEIEATKGELCSDASGEVLLIATALRMMSQGVAEHAEELRADEAHLKAEDADNRAALYDRMYKAILDMANDVETTAQSRIASLEAAITEELSENRKLGISSVLHDFQAFAVLQQRRLSAALAEKGESKTLNQEFNCPPKTSALTEPKPRTCGDCAHFGEPPLFMCSTWNKCVTASDTAPINCFHSRSAREKGAQS